MKYLIIFITFFALSVKKVNAQNDSYKTKSYYDSQGIVFRDFNGNELPNNSIEYIDKIELGTSSYLFVINKNKFGLFDSLGLQLTEIKYDHDSLLFPFEEIYTYNKEEIIFKIFSNQRQKKGLILANGKELVPCIYDDIFTYYNNEFICNGEKSGIINSEGKVILPFEYQKITTKGWFNTDYLVKKDGLWGGINRKAENTLPIVYDTLISEKFGFLAVKNGNYGLIDSMSNTILEFEYSSIASIYNPILKQYFFLIEKEGKLGVIDLTKKIIIPVKYRFLNKINDNFYKVKNDSNWALYSIKDHKEVTGFVFDKFYSTPYRDLFIFKQNEKSGFVKGDGEIIYIDNDINISEDQSCFYNGVLYFVFYQFDGQEGIINEFGQVTVEPQFQELNEDDVINGFIWSYQNKQSHLIDLVNGSKVYSLNEKDYNKIITNQSGIFQDSIKKIRYHLDLEVNGTQLDTTLYQNGSIKSISSYKAYKKNGQTKEYTEFGQLISVTDYKDDKASKIESFIHPIITFEKKSSANFSLLFSDNEDYLVTIPVDKNNYFLIYNLKTKKFISQIKPKNEVFYKAHPGNSFIIDSILYFGDIDINRHYTYRKKSYYTLNLKTGKENTNVLFDLSPLIKKTGIELNDFQVTYSHYYLSKWYNNYVVYEIKDKKYLEIYSKNILTGELKNIGPILIRNKKKKFLDEQFIEYGNFHYFPEYQLLKTENGEGLTFFHKLNNKSLKLKYSVKYMEDIDSTRSISRFIAIFENELIFEEITYLENKDASVRFYRVDYNNFKKSPITLVNPDSLSLNLNISYASRNVSNNKIIYVSDNIGELSNDTLRIYPNTEEHQEFRYIFKTNEIIGINTYGRIVHCSVDDITEKSLQVIQNKIKFCNLNHSQLDINGYTLNLSNGVFQTKKSLTKHNCDSTTIKASENVIMETDLSIFNSSVIQSVVDNKYILDNLDLNLEKTISFYNRNKKAYKNRHVFLKVFNSSDFLFYSPDGYYMGSKHIGDLVYFVNGLDLYPFEQFDLKYNRPDIILDRLGYANQSLIDAYYKAYLKRLKKMGFTEDMLKDDFHIPEIKIENFEEMPTINDQGSIDIKLDINDTKYNLDRINVWINDVAIYGTNGISLRDKNINHYQITLNLKLAKGKNKVQVSALNQAGAESYKETFEIECTKGKEKPNLYLITIGESEFEQSNFNLTYAAKDATDIATLFSKSNIYENVYTKTLINEQVTKDNVIALKSFLQQADINDQVMIFIAGHGVLEENYDYYFATYDMDFSNPKDKGLAYGNLENLLDGIKPLKKALLIDACHSGEIDKDEIQLAVTDNTESGEIQFRAVGNSIKPKLGSQNTSELTKSLFTDLRKGTGATVISSAGGMEFAMESAEWKNGLFTYCLLNGITSKKADLNNDGEVWLSELQKYVSEQVTILSNGKQQPTSRIENQTVNFRVW